MGIQNRADALEKCLVVSQKIKFKYRSTIWPSNFTTARYNTKRIENTCSPKNLYMNIQSSIIHKSKRVETT